MSLFEYSNELNKLRKKLKLHKGAVRSVEFDRSGKFLVSGSKDKSFKITDIVSIGLVMFKFSAHFSVQHRFSLQSFGLSQISPKYVQNIYIHIYLLKNYITQTKCGENVLFAKCCNLR